MKMQLIDYQPGNCTKYLMLVNKIEKNTKEAMMLSIPNGGFCISIINFGKIIIVPTDSFFTISYLVSKGIAIGDAPAILSFISKIGVEVENETFEEWYE